MDSVFVVINESQPKGAPMVLTEIVHPARWSYQEALDDLRDIAEEAGVYLDEDASTVYVPIQNTHLESDEYYIIELEVKSRG